MRTEEFARLLENHPESPLVPVAGRELYGSQWPPRGDTDLAAWVRTHRPKEGSVGVRSVRDNGEGMVEIDVEWTADVERTVCETGTGHFSGQVTLDVRDFVDMDTGGVNWDGVDDELYDLIGNMDDPESALDDVDWNDSDIVDGPDMNGDVTVLDNDSRSMIEDWVETNLENE